MFFCQGLKIQSQILRLRGLLGVNGLSDHESGHNKSLLWTIGGLRDDFPEHFNIAVQENRRVDIHRSLEIFFVSRFLITEAKTT